MEDAIVTIQFPRGPLPVRGGRCPLDGDEKVRAEDLVEAQSLAHALGLYGLEGAVERKVGTTGTSASVTLPPDLMARLGIKPGSVVEIGAAGDALVIRKAQKPKRRRRS